MAKGTVDKWKSKKWIDVIAPKMFHSRHLGQTIASDSRKVVGRIITVNLSEVTGDHGSRQKVKLKFKIEKMIEEQAQTKFLGHIVPQESRRTAVRKRSTKVYVNQKVRTRDDKEFNVKSSIVMDRSANRSTKTEISKKFAEILLKEARDAKFSDFISNVLNNRVSITAKRELHKIYPVKHIIIEKTEIAENVELPDEPVGRIRSRRPSGAPERRGFRDRREERPAREKKVEGGKVEDSETPKSGAPKENLKTRKPENPEPEEPKPEKKKEEKPAEKKE